MKWRTYHYCVHCYFVDRLQMVMTVWQGLMELIASQKATSKAKDVLICLTLQLFTAHKNAKTNLTTGPWLVPEEDMHNRGVYGPGGDEKVVSALGKLKAVAEQTLRVLDSTLFSSRRTL